MAWKLGKLMEWRRGDEATLKEVSEGLDYYTSLFALPEFQSIL